MRFIRAIVKPVGSALGWALRPLGVVVMLLLSIPWLGRGVGWLWGTLFAAANLLVGLVEGIFWMFRLRPEKHLRVGVIILRDEKGDPLDDAAQVMAGIRHAAEIFYSGARVQLQPAWPQESARFGVKDPLERADGWIKTNPEPGTSRILDVNCKNPALREDLGLPGSEYAFLQTSFDAKGTARRLFGWGAPLTVFIVREINGFWGCSNGPLTDYVTVLGGHGKCIAHELGHASNLWHSPDKSNLMHPRGCGGQELRWWQVWLLRSSRHVSIF
jgi:hypothetical protein